ncbi:hypothetical protein MWH25_07615 [Natroniella acetigena]|uniref:hypothetical protein n=1 Tax=Natroniella acetigena TaxID=52004 RepID=UPI00200B0961|nr:hypothetical protein [Natroniella acetigena]MCK8827608.1 hypothetical protein [Natroniella acetigena]
MKRAWMLLLILSLVVVTAGTAVAGQIYGTKAHGMGGAFTAVADDASAIYWNPAGLVRSGMLGLQANAGGELSGLSDMRDFVSDAENAEDYGSFRELEVPEDSSLQINGMAAANLRRFGLGATFNNQFRVVDEREMPNEGDLDDLDNLDDLDDLDFERSAENELIAEGIFSMGTNLTNGPLNLGTISVGANVKTLYGRYDFYEVNSDNVDPDDYNDNNFENFDPDEFMNDGSTTASGYGLDVGALMRATNMINLGVNVRNAVSSFEWDDDYDRLEDGQPRTVTVGAAANLPFPIGAIVAADIEFPEDEDRIYRLGAEKDIILGLLAVRLGGYQIDGDRTYTGGLGLNLPFVDLNLSGDSDSNYSFAGTVNF